MMMIILRNYAGGRFYICTGKHFSRYKRIKNIGRCQKCSDKFDITHHIYSRNELDHLLSYSVQNVIGFIYQI